MNSLERRRRDPRCRRPARQALGRRATSARSSSSAAAWARRSPTRPRGAASEAATTSSPSSARARRSWSSSRTKSAPSATRSSSRPTTAATASKGLVTDQLKELIAAGRTIDCVLAIGPVPMMRAVAEVTAAARHQDHRQPQLDHGRRHRHVRRLPRRRSAARASSPASTARSSTRTRSISTVLAQRNAMYREHEQQALERFRARGAAEIEQVRKDADCAGGTALRTPGSPSPMPEHDISATRTA